MSSEKKFIRQVEYLIQTGADPNAANSARVPLIFVIIEKLALEEIGFNDIHLGIVLEKILAAGADIQTAYPSILHNPLGYAIIKNVDSPILESLIDFGAEINKPCDLERILYPFELAIRVGNGKIIKFLAENKGEAFATEIRDRFDLPRSSAWRLIRRLVNNEIVDEVKIGNQSLIRIKERYHE